MSRALFPGTFNPFTVGHASVVERALSVFDEIVIAVGYNIEKTSDSNVRQNIQSISRWAESHEYDKIKVIAYAGQMTVDVAKEYHCDCIVRGVRSVKDFEYERDMADINRRLSGIETVLFLAMPDLAAISSSVVRELAAYGRDTTSLLP